MKRINFYIILFFVLLSPANAVVVFDPSNFGQNTLTAIRTLQTTINQAKQITQQITQILNQIKNLQALPGALLNEVSNEIGLQMNDIIRVVDDIKGIASDLHNIEAAYDTMYDAFGNLRHGWDFEIDKDKIYQQMYSSAKNAALTLESLDKIKKDKKRLDDLLSAAKTAEGNKDLQQTNANLQAFVGKQLIQLQQLQSSMIEMQSVTLAKQATLEEQARKMAQDFAKNFIRSSPITPVTNASGGMPTLHR